MQNLDWTNLLIGAAVIGAVFVLILLAFHLVRLTVQAAISLYLLILSFLHRIGRIFLNSFKGSWHPSFLLPNLSGKAQINIPVAPPTHLIYLTILIAGLVESAKILLDTVPRCMVASRIYDCVRPSAEALIPIYFALPLIAFCAATCVHQYLIYRDLTSAEERSSTFSKLYAPWWIGTVGEYLLRIFVLICLLISSGEVLHMMSRFHWAEVLLHGNPALVVAFSNAAMFCAFLLWSGCAFIRGRSMLLPQSYDEIKKQIIPSAVAEILALILWSSVILLFLRPEFSQLVAAAITTTGTLYAASVVWRYRTVAGAARRLSYAIALIIAVSFMLSFSAWHSVQKTVQSFVEAANDPTNDGAAVKR